MISRWTDKLKMVAGGGPIYFTLGSFVFYLLGYLCVRFHLTTLGIGTDLTVLDERYLFAGAKFLVYLFSTVATVLLFVILLALIPGLVYLAWRYARGGRGGRPVVYADGVAPASAERRTGKAVAALVAGMVISVVSIQFVMKQCFVFSNLLLAEELPWTALNLKELLLEEGDNHRALYFVGLVALTALACVLLLYANEGLEPNPTSKFLLALFAFLVGVQFLLLPVNYGVFIMEKETPRVASLGGQLPLAEKHEAWLVWEGHEGTTFLVRDPEGGRTLVTVPKKDVSKTEIIGYDPIFRRIFKKQ